MHERLKNLLLSITRRGTWRQVVRMNVSLILSGIVATIIHLDEPVWALITSVIVITQTRLTQTLSTGREQIVGTLVGAMAGMSAIALEQWCALSVGMVFWVMLMPLAVLVALRPKMRVAIVTLMVVLLFPATGEPFSRPLQRIASIMTGVVVSFAVSFFVLRNEARREVLGNAASLLRRLADLLTGALHQHPDNDALATVDGMCRSLLQDINDGVQEAEVEHPASLARHDPLVARLPGLLRRIRSDAIFISRAAVEGETARTGDILAHERDMLGTVLGQMAARCDQLAATRRGRTLPDGGLCDILDHLQPPGEHWTPVMRFAIGLLHADMRLAVRNIWSDGHTDDGPFPLPAHPVLAEADLAPANPGGGARR
ncbi:FUSC family protein [Komagataeibacter rhaeticus]|uniref:FUSC family protein n=1 Tax=Komagataeibacter rhaeticus TaxID=215221 RepID=UPI0004D56B25|nr:FUSC family protein [Komagataeibacter rhaeticus]KDU94857.1 hypothetical protein GLUCORHAEAF1_11255 [Komagataeibacter rhaeticus AF1]MBL7239329.1 FUSC family protein [Komagataeibacter rhaeticus]PYD55113.1 FUSC family protein [Komagataeibacter rhaeticus]GBQ16440.1 hypothetical protein AA16663_2406 [Komagataeibacter rhaeticus DSM 16663]